MQLEGLALAMAFGCGLYLMQQKREQSNLCFAAEDGDMKIAPAYPSHGKRRYDAAEAGAREFLRNKENGNIELSRQLGRSFARQLLAREEKIDSSFNEGAFTQAKVLHAFAVTKAIDDCAPNSIVAHTVLSAFYDTVEEESPAVFQRINDSAIFSLYLLASDEDNEECEVGEVFAKHCLMEDNPKYIELGEALYQRYLESCCSQIVETAFE